MKVKVHEAGLHDSAGAKLVMEGLTWSVSEDGEGMVGQCISPT